MVCPPRPPVQPQPPLQERRQRLHRAEELDACPQADGLGSLRYPPGGRGHERPLPPRAALVAESVSAFGDRKSTRLNSSHVEISYAVFCLKKKNKKKYIKYYENK